MTVGAEALTGVVGLGFEAYGLYKGNQAAKEGNQAQLGMVQSEMQQDALRRQMMEVNARRQSMQDLRNAQRARSLALTNATRGGGQLGSGLQGGYGQIAGESNVNQLGISQNLQAGEQMFDLKNQENTYKMNYANSQMHSQEAAAWGALGKDMIGAMGPVGRLSGN